MKKSILAGIFAIGTIISVLAQDDLENTEPKFEVKVITSVESIVPMGLGRSRLITTVAARDSLQNKRKMMTPAINQIARIFV